MSRAIGQPGDEPDVGKLTDYERTKEAAMISLWVQVVSRVCPKATITFRAETTQGDMYYQCTVRTGTSRLCTENCPAKRSLCRQEEHRRHGLGSSSLLGLAPNSTPWPVCLLWHPLRNLLERTRLPIHDANLALSQLNRSSYISDGGRLPR